jgi:hypothetical protein
MHSSAAVRKEKAAQKKAFKDNSAAVEKINAERTTELSEDVVRMLRGLPDGIEQTRETILGRGIRLWEKDLKADAAICKDRNCDHILVHEPASKTAYQEAMESAIPFMHGEILPDSVRFGKADCHLGCMIMSSNMHLLEGGMFRLEIARDPYLSSSPYLSSMYRCRHGYGECTHFF